MSEPIYSDFKVVMAMPHLSEQMVTSGRMLTLIAFILQIMQSLRWNVKVITLHIDL